VLLVFLAWMVARPRPDRGDVGGFMPMGGVG